MSIWLRSQRYLFYDINITFVKNLLKQSLVKIFLIALLIIACKEDVKEETVEKAEVEFSFNVEEFADIKILRYQIPGWENLTLKEQKLVYYLTEAGSAGRDIMWDQNYRHNLKIRRALEKIYVEYGGDGKLTDNQKAFDAYLKRVWFSNGIHHHYSNDKLKPEFSEEYLNELLKTTNTTLDEEAFNVIFNEEDAKKVNQAKGVDNVALSAVDFYGPDVTSDDVINYYKVKTSPDPERPLSYSGFVNPVLVPQYNEAGEITAIDVTQPKGFAQQMLYYSKSYNHLPDVN